MSKKCYICLHLSHNVTIIKTNLIFSSKCIQKAHLHILVVHLTVQVQAGVLVGGADVAHGGGAQVGNAVAHTAVAAQAHQTTLY